MADLAPVGACVRCTHSVEDHNHAAPTEKVWPRVGHCVLESDRHGKSCDCAMYVMRTVAA